MKKATKEQNCEDIGPGFEDFLTFEWPGTVEGCYEPPKDAIDDNFKKINY